MLVLGTAMPHLLAGIDWGGDWKLTLWIASLLALLAGVAVWRLGEAPSLARVPTSTSSRLAGLAAFGIADFRRAASAYFGHMWELYTLWTLIPLLLIAANPSLSPQALSLLSFALIAVGAPGCWLGGWLSQHLGSRRVAILGLAGSAIGCLLYPWIAPHVGFAALMVYLAAWSLLAVIDSPQFSALSANACPATLVGSALTLQNAIGFAISAVSIGLLVPWLPVLEATIAWWLLPGPLLGLLALRRLGRPARVEP
jgi:predicted MFS family arabinose efflux permease